MKTCWLLTLLVATSAFAVEPVANSRNKAERLEWFRDLGFGMFIHWSHDSQLGSVISHSMVGADDDFLDRFVNELPKTFNPRKFHPQDWATLAKLAGMRYLIFTTKHHSGFCMYDTRTTDFGIMHTPFKRDLDVNERLENWVASPVVSVATTGNFVIPVQGLKADRAYELRAKVKHPLLTGFGSEVRVAPAKAERWHPPIDAKSPANAANSPPWW